MSGSYRQCSQCGKRALGIATRCPGCGSALLSPAVRDVGTGPDLSRLLAPKVVGGLIAIAVVLVATGLAWSHRSPKQPPAPVADSASTASRVAYTTEAAARLETRTPARVPAAGPGELLVARTWTNVRKSRDKLAGVEGVLLPGDTILADSLVGGWYRVVLEGKVLGYVHRSTLARR